MAVDHVGSNARRWRFIQGSTHDHWNAVKTNNLRCFLYSVSALLGECGTQCMLVPGVNSWSLHVGIEWDHLTLYSAMMVELWTRKREMGDEDESNVEDNEKCGILVAWLGWEDPVSVLLHARSGLVPAESGMVNWPAHNILSSSSFSWWFVSSSLFSLLPFLNSTITWEHEVKSSLSISPCLEQVLTPSSVNTAHIIHTELHMPCTAYGDYWIHWILHSSHTASWNDRLSPATSQFLSS